MLASWRPPWEAIWPLGAVLGRSWGFLGHLRSHLEASQAISSHLGAHLGLSEALLEPSWVLGHLGRSADPVQVQGRGSGR
eukprot:3133520-Pyramimonas_sp.AAC.1